MGSDPLTTVGTFFSPLGAAGASIAEEQRQGEKLLKQQQEAQDKQLAEVRTQKEREEKRARGRDRRATQRRQAATAQKGQAGRRGTILTSPLGLVGGAAGGSRRTVLGA